LKTIATAQSDFRANDRDWNHANDYWRADVAGLYALEVEGYAIKLIELSVAAADDRPTTSMERHAVKSPKAAFWYRALPFADEPQRAPDRFAASCFPEVLREGQLGTYLISEENVVRRKLLGHARGIDAHPTKEQVKAENWETID
jgi:hypothetical protein